MAAFPNLHKASKDDITVYAALSKPPPSQYVNASRWYNHIETLLSISGISSERNGVTIDGLASITEEAAANSKDGVELFGEERAAGKSWLVLTELHGDKPDIKEAEEDLRSNQMAGVDWRASKIVKVGYGFKFLRTLFTIVDDLVSLNTAIQITGGIPLTREYRMEKNSKGKL